MSAGWELQPRAALRGEVDVPGDKSIAHRALMFAALAQGESRLRHLSTGHDVASTAGCMRALGVEIDSDDEEVTVTGVGLGGLRAPVGPLDCGNSGTTMRLLAGILAGQRFDSILDGDRSLRGRPMERIAEPLRAMGAEVALSEDGTAPLRLRGGRLRGVTYRPPVASAQIKSCVLLAGLFADGATRVVEPHLSRDHTERLLEAQGAGLERVGLEVRLTPPRSLRPLDGRIPGDISSAAYWLVAATLLPESSLALPGVGLNPTRAAIVRLLQSWGARIEVQAGSAWHGEPVGDLRVVGVRRPLSGGRVAAEDVPGLIDELPLLALVAPFTEQGVEISGAGELRFKESDRLATTAAALRALGGSVDEFPDGLAVAGGSGLEGGTVDAAGDHRIALATAAVSVAARAPVRVEGADAAAVSYPGFQRLLEAVGA